MRKYALQQFKGKLTKEELTGIVDLLSEFIIEPRFETNNRFLLTKINEAVKFQKQSKRFEHNYYSLIEKVRTFSPVETYFLLEEIQSSWQKEADKPKALERFVNSLM